jgi:hypothetical protein
VFSGPSLRRPDSTRAAALHGMFSLLYPRAVRRARSAGSERSALLAALSLCASCDDGAYAVRVHVPGDAARAVRIELSVLRSCDEIRAPGDVVITTLASVDLGREEAGDIGAIDPGSYGLYGRAFEEGCALYAAGCAPITLEAGGEGTLDVHLLAVPPRGCAIGEICASEHCGPPGGRCLDDGAACSAQASCCSGVCDGQACGRSDCIAAGGGCTTSADCCGGATCMLGACFGFGGEGCAPAGELCVLDSDCCGQLCDSGHCALLDGCTVSGELCDDGEDCCSGDCSDTCEPVSECQPAGEVCPGGAGDCCGGTCEGAPPRCLLDVGCRPIGELCDDDSECCSDDCSFDQCE